MSDTFLHIKEVNKWYGDFHVLKDFSLEIPKNAVFGLLGPNGAGKTSLLRLITLINKTTTGEIILGGKKLSTEDLNRIGYLPEERGLYQKMYVEEYLKYIGSIRQLNKNEVKTQIERWLSSFQLEEKRKELIQNLSKGNQQKVQFIAAVLHNPELLILDEPFSGFDPINEEILKKEIKAFHTEGKTILFSSHRMESVEELCSHVAFVNSGKLLDAGLKQAIKDKHGIKSYVVQSNFSMEEVKNFSLKKKENNRYNWMFNGQLEDIYQHIQELKEGEKILSFQEQQSTLQEIFIKLNSK